jgi:zinc transporter ZupT
MTQSNDSTRAPRSGLAIAICAIAFIAGVATSLMAAYAFKASGQGDLNEAISGMGGPLFAIAAYTFVFFILSPRHRKNPLVWIVLAVITVGAVIDGYEGVGALLRFLAN